MEKKYTPGPWTYQPAINYDGFSISPEGTLPTLGAVERIGVYRMTIESFNFPGSTEANAALISAAPELLEVLERIVNYFDRSDLAPELRFKIDGAKDAISKAYGVKP